MSHPSSNTCKVRMGTGTNRNAPKVEVYQRLLAPENLCRLSETELGQVIGLLWARGMWGNKAYLVSRIVEGNGLGSLREVLSDLLCGKSPPPGRFDALAGSIKGLGPAVCVADCCGIQHRPAIGLWMAGLSLCIWCSTCSWAPPASS